METILNENAIVITGGPGTGKTSIIDYLCKQGYKTVAESGRNIIRQQARTGGNKLPWGNQAQYASEMFQMAVQDFGSILPTGLVTFFDRGIPDVIGYLQLCKIPVPDEMWKAARTCRYAKHVFITPPWKEIFRKDAQRKQTYEEAVATYVMMQEVYTGLDYTLVQVPQTTVEKRAAFMIDFLGL